VNHWKMCDWLVWNFYAFGLYQLKRAEVRGTTRFSQFIHVDVDERLPPDYDEFRSEAP